MLPAGVVSCRAPGWRRAAPVDGKGGNEPSTRAVRGKGTSSGVWLVTRGIALWQLLTHVPCQSVTCHWVSAWPGWSPQGAAGAHHHTGMLAGKHRRGSRERRSCPGIGQRDTGQVGADGFPGQRRDPWCRVRDISALEMWRDGRAPCAVGGGCVERSWRSAPRMSGTRASLPRRRARCSPAGATARSVIRRSPRWTTTAAAGCLTDPRHRCSARPRARRCGLAGSRADTRSHHL